MPLLRPIEPDDHEDVLHLNAANESLLAPMDENRLRQLLGLSDRSDVIEHDGVFAGFVLTFAPGSSYDSENYQWFTGEHGEDFYYLDRIVLHREYRRQGLGGFAYDEIEKLATPYGRLCLEVNVIPPNEPSLDFHQRRGYSEVIRLGDDDKQVALMELRL